MKPFIRFRIGVLLLFVTVTGCSSSGKETDERSLAARKYYIQNCASCHGTEGGGTALGVPLRGRKLGNDAIRNSVLNGSARMPRFAVSDSLLGDLAQWIHELK